MPDDALEAGEIPPAELASSRATAWRTLPGRPRVLHDQHRRRRPRRGARGARLRRGQRLRRLLRHARRATLRAPLSRSTPARSCSTASFRRRSRSSRQSPSSRSAHSMRVFDALRGGCGLQRALPGARRSSSPGSTTALRRSPVTVTLADPRHRRAPQAGGHARASRDDGAHARVFAGDRVAPAAARARSGHARQLRAACRAGRDVRRRSRIHDRDGHAPLRRLRRGRAALRARRGPAGARGDGDRAADAGRHGGDLRRLAARAGGRGFRGAARFRRAGAAARPASSTRRRPPATARWRRRASGTAGMSSSRPGPRRQRACPACSGCCASSSTQVPRPALDDACVAKIQPAPFFLSFSGSAP